MNDKKKICPILAIIRGPDDDKPVCPEGRCVWWNGKSCDITSGQPVSWRQHSAKKGGHTMSPYYRICPRCGAHLDPGEICDCLDTEAKLLIAHVTEKGLPGATNTEQPKAEKTLEGPVSASHDT